MQLTFSQKFSTKALCIYPVFQGQSSTVSAVKSHLEALKKCNEFEGKSGELHFALNLASTLPQKIIFVGLGEEKKLTEQSLMKALSGAVKAAQGHKAHDLTIHLPSAIKKYAQVVTESVVMASYRCAYPYKTGENLKKLEEMSIDAVELVGLGKDKELQKKAERGLHIGGATVTVRDWVNGPPSHVDVHFLEHEARRIGKQSRTRVTIFNKKQLTKMGMGALLGVNRGSVDEARLAVLDYTPRGADKKKPVVLVGKGIIFDSGGYNLKPSGHIEDMQLDKSGAATVLELIELLPRLNIKHRVIAVAPITDNSIDAKAQRPSEIITTYAGTTVEVTNTDAEGRLVLCDALAYAVKEYKPRYIIDVATLTGACMIGLGYRYAGLFGNDEELSAKLKAAGEAVDELLWPMPIHEDDAEKMKGQYADLRNSDSGTSRYAGASKGAAFLKEFVGKTPWAHLDIAGPAFTSDPKKHEDKGATGFGLRVLARFLEDLE